VKKCPFCREDVQGDALKCRYCGSSLVPPQSASQQSYPEPDRGQVLLVLDRGFLYFAKFVLGIVVIILALATGYFGFDLNKARESVDQMRKDVEAAQNDVLKAQKDIATTQERIQAAQKDVQAAKESVIAISKQAQDQLAEAQRKLSDTQAKLEDMLAAAQNDVVKIHTIVVAAVPVPTSGANTAPTAPYRKGFTVPELAALYQFPPALDGTDQTIALIELGGGFRDVDLDKYFADLHLQRPRINVVSVDHGANRPTGDPYSADGQVELDIEVIGAVAPAAHIVVYFAPNTNAGFLDAITTAIRDPINKPSVISISWGGPESSWSSQAMTALDNALRTAAAQGITVVCAAGDNGVTDGVNDGHKHVDFPASSPWVLAVGGTSLSAEGGRITSETAWSAGSATNGTGGGVSDFFALPEWQSNVRLPVREDAGKGRGMPDVAAAADPTNGYRIIVGGRASLLGGTAAAVPLWAGLVVRMNQGLGHRVGYLNARLYQEIGPAGILRAVQHIDANGRPDEPTSPTWDAAAGWGSPNGQRLLDYLRVHPNGP
jgi:hypothetical protein